MPAAWSTKDERQYKHILSSCKRTDRRRSLSTCKRIAAATVNKQRAREGRTLGALGEPGAQWPRVLMALTIGAAAVGLVMAMSPSGKTVRSDVVTAMKQAGAT